MSRNVPITPEKEQEIIAALEKDSHASRVARTLGNVSYATVWRVADRNAIALKAGRETMGRPRLPAEHQVDHDGDRQGAQGAEHPELNELHEALFLRLGHRKPKARISVPHSDRVKERVMQAGLVFLLFLFVVVLYNDSEKVKLVENAFKFLRNLF